MLVDHLIALRERPDGSPVMLQTWSNLTFLHWECDPAHIQALLPEGLTVDTFGDRAFIGLVPFQMLKIRHRSGLWLPTAHNFLETNVRTYVVGPDGRPGVWFFSLDASSRLAVMGGRLFYGLPYFKSKMTFERRGRLRYGLARTCDGTESTVLTEAPQDPVETVPGSLEFWLVERYLLYAMKHARLYSGRVWHKPYEVAACDSQCESVGPVERVLSDVGSTPALSHFSPGVDVEVWPLRPV